MYWTFDKGRKKIRKYEYLFKKHTIRINSAIRTVSKEAKKRGFDSSHLLSYTNTNLKLNYYS